MYIQIARENRNFKEIRETRDKKERKVLSSSLQGHRIVGEYCRKRKNSRLCSLIIAQGIALYSLILSVTIDLSCERKRKVDTTLLHPIPPSSHLISSFETPFSHPTVSLSTNPFHYFLNSQVKFKLILYLLLPRELGSSSSAALKRKGSKGKWRIET